MMTHGRMTFHSLPSSCISILKYVLKLSQLRSWKRFHGVVIVAGRRSLASEEQAVRGATRYKGRRTPHSWWSRASRGCGSTL